MEIDYTRRCSAESIIRLVGCETQMAGHVHRVRDHGGLLFIDLRENGEITQCVVSPDSPVFALAETIKPEFCIAVSGKIVERDLETVNENIMTGKVELVVENIEILNECPELPLPVFGEPDYPEDLRLKYRFLDLRRETMRRNILTRSKVIKDARNWMHMRNYVEFQTPLLTSSSPEGARDYLVPSYNKPGYAYALPQAPQQFKQLCISAGFDKYFQIAPCFRAEASRSDRLPCEFYQLDMERAYSDQEGIFRDIENLVAVIFTENTDWEYSHRRPFQRIDYDTAISLYGTDKPDLRNPIVMDDATEHFKDSGFKLFADMVEKGEKIWGIPAPTGGSRAFCDKMDKWAKSEEIGQKGLGYIYFRDEEGKVSGAGPLANNIGVERTESIRTQFSLQEGDSIFFVTGNPDEFLEFAGQARIKIGQDLNLIDEKDFQFCFITDFPMFKKDRRTGKIKFNHNPFSMPQGDDIEDIENPLDIKAYQYDLVCNGYELGSGSIRAHKPEILQKTFKIAGYPDDELEKNFSGLLRGLTHGAPPHAGAALGLDRIVMLICGANNLRDVVMFPPNAGGDDILMGAPAPLTQDQLDELGLRLKPTISDIG